MKNSLASLDSFKTLDLERLKDFYSTTQFEETFYPYIKDIPGKSLIKNSAALMDVINKPEMGLVSLEPFDPNLLNAAIQLKPGPIPGFDMGYLKGNSLISASASSPNLHSPRENSASPTIPQISASTSTSDISAISAMFGISSGGKLYARKRTSIPSTPSSSKKSKPNSVTPTPSPSSTPNRVIKHF